MATVSYGSLPFKEQIAFFRRKLPKTSASWTQFLHEEHDYAFVVAGANRIDLVKDFQEAVDAAIAQHETLAQFRKRFDAIVAKYGWQYNGGRNWRSRVIYETNLRTSYAAGRYAQLQSMKMHMPYWQYVHADGEQHPRPQHLAWNGLVLAADDPWWQSHFPPGGWGCKCYVQAYSADRLARAGLKVGTAPPDNMQLVTVGAQGPFPRQVWTPEGIDPGFGYTPGKHVFDSMVQQALDKTAELPAQAAAQAAAETLNGDGATQALDQGYANWQAELLDAGHARNDAYAVGAIEPDVVEAMTAHGVEPATAEIVARDKEVIHALRDAKASRIGAPIAFTPAELSALPKLLRSRRAVLLDQADGTLLYVVDASDRRQGGKIVIAVNYRLKTNQGKQTTNAFRTASLVDLIDIRKDVNAGKLKLLAGSVQ